MLLEENRDLHRGNALESVDDALCILEVGSGLLEHGRGDLGPDQAPVHLGVDACDRQAFKTYLGEGARLVALERDPTRVGPGGDECGSEAEGRLSRVLVPES